jgi:hypothetical protein
VTPLSVVRRARLATEQYAVLQGLADDVNRANARTVASIIDTGQRLLAAKEAAGHGGWEPLFDGTLERPIVFSIRTARRYMAVAGNALIGKSDKLAVFPTALTVLEELAKLPDEILLAGLKDGLINPEMESADVARLHGIAGKLVACEGRPTAAPAVSPPPRFVPAGRERYVTFPVIDASSKKPTTVLVNGGPEWSAREAQDRLLTAVKTEFDEYGACREDRPALAKILRQLATDIDAGTQMMAVSDQYVDSPAYDIPQAHKITRIIPGEVAEPQVREVAAAVTDRRWPEF